MEPGNVLARKRRLRELESALRALQSGAGAPAGPADRRTARAVATGWARVDALLGVRGPEGEDGEAGRAPGLARGVLHEWCGAARGGPRARWTPPLILLVHLAGRALAAGDEPGSAGGGKEARLVLWIGRAVWPYPGLLARPGSAEGAALVERSLCIDPPDAASRLWALALALRSPSVAAVVGDARGLDLAASRRLQLAAEAGGALALLARPPEEERVLSAAATRWRVRLVPSAGDAPRFPRWSVELLRVKGIQELRGAPSAGGRSGEEPWGGIMEYDRAQGLVVEPSELADRSGPAPAEARGASVPKTA